MAATGSVEYLASDYLYAVQFGAVKIAAHLQPLLPYGVVDEDDWYWFLYHASQPFEYGVDVLLDPIVVVPIMCSLLKPKRRARYILNAFTESVGSNTTIMDEVATWALRIYEMYPRDVDVKTAVFTAIWRANSAYISSTWQKPGVNFIYHTLCNVEYIKDPRLMRLLALIFAKFDFKLHNQYSVLLLYIYHAYITQTIPTMPFIYDNLVYGTQADKHGEAPTWIQVKLVDGHRRTRQHPDKTFNHYVITVGPYDCVYLPAKYVESLVFYVDEESVNETDLGVEYNAANKNYYILRANTRYNMNVADLYFRVACLNFGNYAWLTSILKN